MIHIQNFAKLLECHYRTGLDIQFIFQAMQPGFPCGLQVANARLQCRALLPTFSEFHYSVYIFLDCLEDL